MMIERFVKWFEKHIDEIPRYLSRQLLQLNSIKEFCNLFPTCSGCPFEEEHKGCIFRNKTPREW